MLRSSNRRGSRPACPALCWVLFVPLFSIDTGFCQNGRGIYEIGVVTGLGPNMDRVPGFWNDSDDLLDIGSASPAAATRTYVESTVTPVTARPPSVDGDFGDPCRALPRVACIELLGAHGLPTFITVTNPEPM